MAVHFRPLPGLTLAALVGLAVLLSLGTWQLHRLSWKNALIATIAQRAEAEPVALAAALELPEDARAYRTVLVEGRFDHTREIYLFAQGPGGPGVKVITPLRLSDGRAVLVDRGFVPQHLRDPAARPNGQSAGPVAIEGVLRPPSPANALAVGPDPAARLHFARDLEAMADMVAEPGQSVLRGILIEAAPTAGAPRAPEWPRPSRVTPDLSNRHLEYALTWYALALTLAMVYLAYHVPSGRLAWR